MSLIRSALPLLFVLLSSEVLAQTGQDSAGVQQSPYSAFASFSLNTVKAKRFSYRSIDDLMLQIPGIWVRSTGSPGQVALIRWGNRAQESALLLDGRLLSDPWSGMADMNLTPVEMIGRIEHYTLRDPSSEIPAGVAVQLVSRTVPENQPYTGIVYRSGTYQFSLLDVTFARKLGSRFEIISEAAIKRYGESLESRYFKGQTISSKMTYRAANWLELRYSILNSIADLDLPFAQRMTTDLLILDTPHRKRSRTDHFFEIVNSLGKYRSVFSASYITVRHELRDRDFTPLEVIPADRLHFKFHQKCSPYGIFFYWGAGTQRRSARPESGSFKDHIHDAWLHTDISFPAGITFSPGFNIHSSCGETRALISAVLGMRTDRMSIWTGFREEAADPALGERFGVPFQPSGPIEPEDRYLTQSLFPVLPNPSLKPERQAKMESGVKLTLSRILESTFSAYIQKTKNRIGIEKADDVLMFVNAGSVTKGALDWTVDFGPVRGFELNTAFHAEKRQGENRIMPESPSIHGWAGIGWGQGFFKKDLIVFLTAGLRFWSGFQILDPYGSGDPPLRKEEAGYSLDLKANLQVIHNAILSVELDNVTGRDIGFMSHFRMPVRTMRMGIEWTLYD